MAVTKMCLLAVLMAWHLASVSGQCQSALQAVTNLTNSQTAATVVYQSPIASGSSRGVCTSQSTCCSTTAEQLLRTDSLSRFQSLLRSKLRATISPCINNNSLAVESADYVVEWKTLMIDLLNTAFSQYSTPTLLDPFSNYMSNGIMSLNLPDFQVELQSVFFEIYLRSFKLSIEITPGNTVPNTLAFRQCFYLNLFFPENRERLNQRYRILLPRLNLLLRYLLALKTSDSVLERIMDHMLSPECGDALLRLTHCKECSGTTSSSSSCTPFCQNVLRGCLVDLTEVGDVLQEFATQMDATKRKLNIDNPFQAIDLLSTTVLDVVDSGRNIAFRKDMIETTCNVKFSSGSKRRRSAAHIAPFHNIRRRQSNSPDPIAAIGRSVTCAKNVAQAIRSLPEQLCIAAGSSSTSSCWNGMTIGNYTKALVSPDRLSQVNNPELLKVYPNTGLQYRDAIAQLKNMSAQLASCSGNIDCGAKLASLSVPSSSDFTLTGPRYENISRPIITPVPVSTTVVDPATTTQHMSSPSSTIATPYHSSIFSESSTITFEPTPTRLIDETSILPNESTRSATDTSILSSSFDAISATPSLTPSHSSHISTVSPMSFTESALFTESLSIFVPATSSSPTSYIETASSAHIQETISAGLSESSSLIIVQVSSEEPLLPFSLFTTPTPVIPVSSFDITPSTQPNSGSSSISNLMIGAFGAGWVLLVISLFVNFMLVVVVMKRRRCSTADKCNTTIQANGISTTSSSAVYANGTGKAFVDTSKASHNIYTSQEPDIAKNQLAKKPAAVHNTPRVLYPPKYSSNPVTTV